MESNPFLFIRYLTPFKLWNTFKNLLSYRLSLLSKKPVVWGMPFFLHLESTNYCNLYCKECPTGMGILTRPQGILSFESFKTYFDPIKRNIIYLVLYFQGEPFLNPHLLKMIRYAKANRVYTMVSTNGHFFGNEQKVRGLIQSGLGSLVISLDGISQETYQKYREKGSLPKVLEGVENCIRIKRQLRAKFPKIYLQFLVMRHNEHELEEVRRLGKRLGVDKVLFKTAQLYGFNDAEEILPRNPTYRRYVKTDGAYQLKGKIRNRCVALWNDTLITWDGQVLPCCFDKNADYKMGQLPNQHKNQYGEERLNHSNKENDSILNPSSSFQDIWRSKNYQEFRKRILLDRSATSMCRNCTVEVKIFVD